MVKIAQEEPHDRRRDADRRTTARPRSGTGARPRRSRRESRYTLVLSADDGDNPKTIKNYLIVLRGTGSGTSCPGAAPVIAHTPANQTTRLDLTPVATITDDKGLKDAPLFYYSTTNPGATPDLSHDDAAVDDPDDGRQQERHSTPPTVPNPVASATAGTTATIYYVIVADDDDDPMGNCDHTTQSQVYSMA